MRFAIDMLSLASGLMKSDAKRAKVDQVPLNKLARRKKTGIEWKKRCARQDQTNEYNERVSGWKEDKSGTGLRR